MAGFLRPNIIKYTTPGKFEQSLLLFTSFVLYFFAKHNQNANKRKAHTCPTTLSPVPPFFSLLSIGFTNNSNNNIVHSRVQVFINYAFLCRTNEGWGGNAKMNKHTNTGEVETIIISLSLFFFFLR